MSVSKIKICHIVATLGFGGAERLVLDLARLSDHQKFDVEILCVIACGPLEDEFKKINVPVKIIGKKTKLGLGAIWKIRQYLIETQPDIVHSHLFAGDCWGKIGARLAGIKHIVSTEHNVNVSESFLKSVIKKWTNSFSERIIVISQAVKKYVMTKYETSADKIEVIYNGIEIDRFHFKEPNFDKQKIIFGTVGRLTKQKGHRYLIEAFAKLIDKFNEAELWIVGQGELRLELQKQITDFGLENRIKLLGVCQNIPEILNKFDVFVMPSIWEGLGIALIEAMASGLPVIGSRVDGIAEIIEDEVNGILVETENSIELTDKMFKLIENPELASKFALAGRQTVIDKFDLSRIVKAYEQVYLEILQ
jgi:glycosyltransferase involved in cell wall biosynthesis